MPGRDGTGPVGTGACRRGRGMRFNCRGNSGNGVGRGMRCGLNSAGSGVSPENRKESLEEHRNFLKSRHDCIEKELESF